MKKSAAERFWPKVEKSAGCWLWTGAVRSSGYGSFYLGGYPENPRWGSPHRFSYELVHGPLAAGVDVLHRCDNRLCVRPGHLRAGDHSDNMADMVAKGRHVAARGRAMTPAQRSNALARVRAGEPVPVVATSLGYKRNTIDKLLVRARARGDASAIAGSCWATRRR